MVAPTVKGATVVDARCDALQTLFHELGAVSLTGVVPQFNTLNLFTVPRYHSVSMVMPAAPRRRFAVTGWLSAR